MERQSVDSSSIEAIGFDVVTSTLEIEFRNGSVYQYFDIPEQVWQGLIGASSKGEYFSAAIRGVYRFARA